MANQKYGSTLALTRSHLEAIGLVSAEWSNLEVALISALAEMLKLDLPQALAVGGLLANSGFIVLVRLSYVLDGWNDIAPELERMQKQFDALYIERNLIVHGTWNVHFYRNHITGQTQIRHSASASGFGIPKRGKKLVSPFEFTTPELRDVARAAREATQALLHLVWRKPPPLPKTPALERVLARQIQRTGSQPASQPRSSRP